MKASKLLLVLTVLAAATALTPAFAKGRAPAHHGGGSNNNAAPEKKPDPIAQAVVKAVSSNSITIGNDKAQKTYALEPGINGIGGTDVYLNGVKTTISAITVGMSVSVSGDTSRATTILAQGAPAKKDAAAAGKKGKGKK